MKLNWISLLMKNEITSGHLSIFIKENKLG